MPEQESTEGKQPSDFKSDDEFYEEIGGKADKLDDDEIERLAVGRAQEVARNEGGFEPGSLVAHPEDVFTWHLKSVEGNTAHCVIPENESKSGKREEKQFPLNELFDVDVASEYARNISAIRAMKRRGQLS
jgi:hypothetical protein